MPQYIRAKMKGSVFFFTVVLAERPSDLLVEKIELLRRSYQTVQQHRRSKLSQSVFCLTTFTPFGNCRMVMQIFLPDGA
jgi:hypothetical protein